MKKIMYAIALMSAFSFAACSSQSGEEAGNGDERVEEMEDRAEERAGELEDMDEDMDTTAVIE